MFEQVGELIVKRYGFILTDPRCAKSIEAGKRKFRERERTERVERKRPSGFKKTFEEYVGKGVQKKLF